MDVFPVFQVSHEADGYFPDTSPVTSPDAQSKLSSPVTPAPGSLSNEVTGLFDSIVGSPVTSLSISDYAADLTLLLEPLIPLPDELLLLPMPVPMRPSLPLGVSHHWSQSPWLTHLQWTCPMRGLSTLTANRATPAGTR